MSAPHKTTKTSDNKCQCGHSVLYRKAPTKQTEKSPINSFSRAQLQWIVLISYVQFSDINPLPHSNNNHIVIQGFKISCFPATVLTPPSSWPSGDPTRSRLSTREHCWPSEGPVCCVRVFPGLTSTRLTVNIKWQYKWKSGPSDVEKMECKETIYVSRISRISIGPRGQLISSPQDCSSNCSNTLPNHLGKVLWLIYRKHQCLLSFIKLWAKCS